MSIFSTLSEEPIIKGTSVTLPIVKVGTRAHDEKGKTYILTKEALESGGQSWAGGIVTVNHNQSCWPDTEGHQDWQGRHPETS
jgi:hypothetical protein